MNVTEMSKWEVVGLQRGLHELRNRVYNGASKEDILSMIDACLWMTGEDWPEEE